MSGHTGYRLSDDFYDFSGDEPVSQPDYEYSGRHLDFCDEELGPPPVVGLGEPEGVISEAVAIGRWIIDVPLRFVRAVTGGDATDPGRDRASE